MQRVGEMNSTKIKAPQTHLSLGTPVLLTTSLHSDLHRRNGSDVL